MCFGSLTHTQNGLEKEVVNIIDSFLLPGGWLGEYV